MNEFDRLATSLLTGGTLPFDYLIFRAAKIFSVLPHEVAEAQLIDVARWLRYEAIERQVAAAKGMQR